MDRGSPRRRHSCAEPASQFGWQFRQDAPEQEIHVRIRHGDMAGSDHWPIARLLGHSVARLTGHYAHIGDGKIEAAAQRVRQTIGGLTSGEQSGA